MATGILHHVLTAGQTLAGNLAAPASGSTAGTTGTSSSSSDADAQSATISANDFLTLLVTEMQNQDPTADTDPNEYIDQLVQVNSLEQLININQTLTTDLGGPSSSSGSGSGGGATADVAGNAAHANAASAVGPTSVLQGAARKTSALGALSSVTPAAQAPGNLSLPRPNAAAQRVAHALDGRTHAQPTTGTTQAAQ